MSYDKLGMVQCCDKTGNKFMSMGINLKRIKTQHVNADSDHIIHFCHKDDVLQDYLFLLFHYLVCKSDGVGENEKIFPNWAKFVKLDANKGTDSKVSSKFREVWKQMFKLAEGYMDKLSEEMDDESITADIYVKYALDQISETLSTHGGKRRGVQDLADANLAPQVGVKLLY